MMPMMLMNLVMVVAVVGEVLVEMAMSTVEPVTVLPTGSAMRSKPN